MKMFDFYKIELDTRAEQRRKERELKMKLDDQDQSCDYPRVFGLD